VLIVLINSLFYWEKFCYLNEKKGLFFFPHLTRLVARMEGRDHYDLIPILLSPFLEAKIFINESIGWSVRLDFSL
jgi:hypothetical protein